MNLYHYCPNAAFLSIVSTRTIWVSEFSLSNDLLEGKWIRKIVSDCCDERKLVIFDRDALLRQLDGIISFLGAAGFCMSEEPDILSQWRGYADDGCGVSIGFNQNYFEQLGTVKMDRSDTFNASLKKVQYDVEKQKKILDADLEKIFELVSEGALTTPSLLSMETPEQQTQREKDFRNLTLATFALFPHLYTFKNPAFREENEWRLISLVTHGSKQSDDLTWELSRMDFRALKDRIVPYRSINLERLDEAPIVDVVLGPRNITPERVVEASLMRHGWGIVPVRRSSASYR
jgi:hypothetical protein